MTTKASLSYSSKMAKSKAVQQQKRNKRSGAKAKQSAVPAGVKPVIDYAELLANPCGGPLVPSPFGGGNGGLVVRTERDFILGGTTNTAGALVWAPGSMAVAHASATSDGVNLSFTPAEYYVPGYDFIANNAKQYRCISACMQVSWAGTELERGGVLSMSPCASPEATSTTTTVAELRSSAGYVFRVPNDHQELVWRPQETELEYTQPSPAVTMFSNYNNTAMVLTFAGIKANAGGIRVRLVAVYEWIPNVATGSGLVVRNTRPPVGNITLGGLIGALDTTGDWMFRTAGAAGKAVASLASGMTAVKTLVRGSARLLALAA